MKEICLMNRTSWNKWITFAFISLKKSQQLYWFCCLNSRSRHQACRSSLCLCFLPCSIILSVRAEPHESNHPVWMLNVTSYFWPEVQQRWIACVCGGNTLISTHMQWKDLLIWDPLPLDRSALRNAWENAEERIPNHKNQTKRHWFLQRNKVLTHLPDEWHHLLHYMLAEGNDNKKFLWRKRY